MFHPDTLQSAFQSLHGKFMDWLADKGGGGAIDLVMHVQNTDFREAVQWLSRQDLTFHTESSQQHLQPVQEPHSLQMPNQKDERWNAVRDYLVETRKLPAALIDRLHQRSMVYADDYQNAVFVRFSTRTTGDIWERVEPTGASLRGTWGESNSFHGLASGSPREQGWFWIAAGQGTIQRVLLTESPINALSLTSRRRAATGLNIDGWPNRFIQQACTRSGHPVIQCPFVDLVRTVNFIGNCGGLDIQGFQRSP
jgi:hypothetical protein